MKQVWKYFLQQKLKEILIGSIVLLAIIFIPYMIGDTTLGDNAMQCGLFQTGGSVRNSSLEYDCSFGDKYADGIAYVILALLIVALLFLAYVLLHTWIHSNWDKANERVDRERRNLNQSRGKQ